MALGNRTLKPGTLISILGEIYKNQETGTLVLQQEKTNKFLYSEEGKFIFAASSAPEDRFTQILVDKGKLSEEQLDIAQEKREGRTIGRTLVEMGFLTSNDLLEALVDQMHKIARGVANWESGRAVFKADVLPKNVAKLPVSSPRMILDTALAVEDREWASSELGNLETPIEMSKAEQEAAIGFQLAAHEVKLIEAIDGKKNAREICETCNIEVFNGARIIIGLNKLGLCHVKQTFAPAEKHRKNREEDESSDPFVETIEPQPSRFETTEPESEIQKVEEIEDVQEIEDVEEAQEVEGVEDPVISGTPEELPFASGSSAAPEDNQAEEAEDEAPESIPAWVPNPMPPPPEEEEDETFKKKKGVSGLLIGLSAAVIITVVLTAAYYFLYMRRDSSPKVASNFNLPHQTTLTTDKTGVKTPASKPEATKPENTEAVTTPPVEKKPVEKKEPPKEVKKTPPEVVHVNTPATAVNRAASADVKKADKLMREGRYSEAAGVYEGIYRSLKGSFVVNVEVVCQAESVRKAFEASKGDPAFILLHYKLGSRDCYRILWGVYSDRASAEDGLKSMPEFLLMDAKPRVAPRVK